MTDDKFTIVVKKVRDVYVVHSPEIPLKIGDDEEIKAVEDTAPLAIESWVNMAILSKSPTFFRFAIGIIDRIIALYYSRKIKRKRELVATLRSFIGA